GPISIHFEGASLREYFELGCAIHVLDNTTGKEIELLRSFLKDEEIPAKDEERDPLVEFLFGNSSDQLRTEVPRFNLESRSGMIEEIYYHFFVREGKAANLYGDKLKGF